MQTLNFGHVPGLTQEEQKQLQDLAAAYNYHQSRNATKDKYYEGHISLRDVNLGIALPQGLRNLEVGCSWGQKAVDVLAARSMFDGFVGTGGSLDGCFYPLDVILQAASLPVPHHPVVGRQTGIEPHGFDGHRAADPHRGPIDLPVQVIRRRLCGGKIAAPDAAVLQIFSQPLNVCHVLLLSGPGALCFLSQISFF